MPWESDIESYDEQNERGLGAYQEAHETADHAWGATLSELADAMRLLDAWGRNIPNRNDLRRETNLRSAEDDLATATHLAIVLQARAAIEAAEIQVEGTQRLVWGTWFLVIVTAVLAAAAFWTG